MDGSPIDRPEFAADADPHVVAQAIRERGVALVRGALRAAMLESLLPLRFTPEPGRKPQPGYWASILNLLSVRAVVAEYGRSCVLDTLRDYIGAADAPRATNGFRVRRADATASADGTAGWHNDAWGANRGGMVVIWTAMTRCGEDAPGLSFIVDPNVGNWRPPSMMGETFGPQAQREREIIEHFGASRLWRPTLDVGDTFMFAPFCLHSIFRAPGMTVDRYNLEVRVHGDDHR
jgi:hypothetical protein